MYALITGGTSGIGRDIAINLSSKGYDLILVSRKENDLEYIKSKCKTHVEFISMDLSKESDCLELLRRTKDLDIDVFINNAGFGDIGYITKTDIKKEINMVKLNDIALLILGKEFIKRFIEKDKGHVMFVASAASFGVAPYMNVYYATKAFVYSLAHGYYRELKDMKSNVQIHVLCPGPVDTRFNEKANTRFNMKALSSEYVGTYAVKKMFKNKFEIVPGFNIKLLHFFSHFVPKKLISKLMRKQSQIR